MEQRKQTIRLVALIVSGTVGLLLLRLWSLQVVYGERYRALSDNNRVRTMPISAPRGLLFDRFGAPLVRNIPMFHVMIHPSQDRNREETLTQLAALDPVALNIRDLSEGEQGTDTAQVVAENVPFSAVARIEARRFELPETEVRVELGREYPFGETAAHLLGYLGHLRTDQVTDEQYRDLPPDSYVGQWGIERIFDTRLRGIPGERIFEVNATGVRTRVLSVRPPVQGDDIVLSLDVRTQRAAEEALGGRRGAIVALEPDTGRILALVSHPSYDPNLFARGITADSWRQLRDDRGHPLFNRALQSRYPPGSTFKTIVAAAALETGGLRPAETVRCTGSVEIAGRVFKCWQDSGHGNVNLKRAISESCDVYFYEIGRRVGIETIAAYARGLGLHTPPGLGIPRETGGIIPTPEWKRTKLGSPWYPGDTANTSIGQGYVGVSPFHMAMAYAFVATGTGVPRPSLLAGGEVEHGYTPQWSDSTLSLLRNALVAVVESPRGTGKNAASPWYTTAGKTGTAQVVSRRDDDRPEQKRHRDHAWFVGYAPASDPKIVVSVLVEHGGHGGSTAAPVARDVLEAYLAPLGPPPPGERK